MSTTAEIETVTAEARALDAAIRGLPDDDLLSRAAAWEELNRLTEARNAALDAEVHDLKNGVEAIEERARSELGMVRQDEIFFQLLDETRVAGKSR